MGFLHPSIDFTLFKGFQAVAVMSNMEMFVAEMSSDSFQLLGMAERGMLLEFFGKRSCYETPYR